MGEESKFYAFLEYMQLQRCNSSLMHIYGYLGDMRVYLYSGTGSIALEKHETKLYAVAGDIYSPMKAQFDVANALRYIYGYVDNRNGRIIYSSF